MLPFIFLVISVLAQQTFAEEPEAIVGGQPALPGEFPHQVSLRLDGNHICGGSIIGPRKILTAAHCCKLGSLIKPNYSNFKVATGSIAINKGELHKVEKIVIHPQYSEKSEDGWKNDVAVITLADSIKYNQYQKPIFLTNSEATNGLRCTLSGWGKIHAIGWLPKELLKMSQAVVARTQCQLYYSDVPLTGSHLCAFNRLGIGACQGDSGGPLICNGVQYGITSWVAPCARGVPDVYTDCYYHREFINNA